MLKLNKILALVVLVAMALPARAALASDVSWYVKNGGNASDSNGGGFIPGASGMNYASTDTLHCNVSDLVLVTTTTATSATCAFDSTSPGNILRINSGTNCTAGYYQILSVTVATATLDRAAGTTGCTAGVFRVGGALKTLGQLNTAMGTSNVKQHGYVQADSTYSISSGVTFNFGVASVLGADITGYTTTAPTLTTKGDEGRPTIQASAGSLTMITLANNNSAHNVVFQNFIIDGNAQTSNTCFSMNNNDAIVRNVKTLSCGTGFKEGGFNFSGERLTATGMITTNGIGIQFNNGGYCIDCYAGDSSASGVAGFSFLKGVCIRCRVANLTGGTTSDGFGFGTLGSPGIVVSDSLCHNVTRSCFVVTQNATTNYEPVTIRNSICSTVGASGFCFDANNASPPTIAPNLLYEDYNGVFPSSGTAYNHWTAGPHDVTVQVNPFVGCGSQNCILNNTATGGKVLRAAGFPGVYGGTSSGDIGGVQHADPKFRIGPF